MGRRYVRPGWATRERDAWTYSDVRAVLNEIEKDSVSRSQKKQEKVKAPATSSPVAKAVTVAEPRAESAPVQEPAKGRTAYFF